MSDPVGWLAEFVEERAILLPRVAAETHLECSSSRAMADAITRLLEHSGNAWWTQHDVALARSWATSHGKLAHRGLVAQRQLLDAGRRESEGSDSQKRSDEDALVTWVTEVVGDPAIRPAAWRDLSDEARRVFERLVVRREFFRILERFTALADRDRVAYWKRWERELADARLEELDVAVCMFLIGGLLIVEFGRSGNACYVYRAPPELPPLRTLSLNGLRASRDFKRTDRRPLLIAGHTLTYVDRLRHQSGWHGRFDIFIMSNRKG
ncbi:MAG: hypothetical protein V3V08_02595 [Nannocystaceae bacterium]